MTPEEELDQAARMLEIVASRLNAAEMAFARSARDMVALSETMAICESDIAAPALFTGGEPMFVVFAERRRTLLKRQLLALEENLSRLRATRLSQRKAVETLLRQKTALEATIDALRADEKRRRSRTA